MRQNTKKVDGFSGGGYSNVFTQVMDVGFTYEEIVLKLENLTIAQVTMVELMLNGDAIIAVPGQHFADLAEHFKRTAETDRIRIPFRDMSLMTDQGQILTNLVTLPGDSLVLKVRTGAALSPSQDGLSPGLGGYMKISSMHHGKVQGIRERKVIPRIVQDQIAAGKSGENNVKTFPTGPQIRRAFFEHGGRMTNLRIKRGNMEVFDAETDDNNADLVQSGFDILANTYIFSPIATRFGIYDGLETAGSKLEIFPTVNAPGDIPVIIHTLENVTDETSSPMSALAG